MHIAILNLSRGHLSRGYCKYLSSILPEIIKNPRVLSILVVLPCKTDLGISHHKVTLFYLDKRFSLNRQLYGALDSFSPNIIFIPTCRVFRYHRVPVVNMLQNMEPFQAPFLANPTSEKLKNLLRIFFSVSSCWFSDSTIAISLHVKKYLLRISFFKRRYIPVIYHGIEPIPALQHVRPKSLPVNVSKFIFAVGSIRPARGLEDLVLAAHFLSSSHPELFFVIAGSVDPGMNNYFRSIVELIQKYDLSDKFIWMGPVDQLSIAWCFSNCELFLMSSRSEACPNVVLESLTYGSTVVSSRTDPMPEFYKDNAFYYERDDPSSLKNALYTALSIDDAERRRRQEISMNLSTSYTWDSCAGSLIQHFSSLINPDSTSTDSKL